MQNTAKNINAWLNDNRDLCVELLRIYLGIALFVRGLYFFSDKERAFAFMHLQEIPFIPYLVAHYVIVAHICGGLLLAIGLLTRAAALVQIPILFGAILFVHGQLGLFSSDQGLEFTLLVLFLLVFFAIYGSGRLSVDGMLAKRRSV